MLHDPKAGHLRKPFTQLIERLTVPIEKGIKKCPPGRVSERPKHITALLHVPTICDYLVTCQRSSRLRS